MIPAPLASFDLLYLAREDHARTGSAWLGVMALQDIPAIAKALLAAGYHLEDISGLDAAEGAVAAYHFDHCTTPGRITLLALAPHDAPVFPSIAAIYQGAEWHERETRDFFGYVFTDNPNFIPLLLPDDMADIHPLKKPEAARASLLTLFAGEGRGSEVQRKAEGFTLLDQPAPTAADDAKAAPAEAKQPEAKADDQPDGGKDA